MDWGSLNGIYLFGFLLLFTAGGFGIGFLLGYLWTVLEEKKFLHSEEYKELQCESNRPLESESQELREMDLSKLAQMPKGDCQWEEPKVYAKGA